MKFELGVCYQNKTKKYLLPVIKDYGRELITKLNSLPKIAIGVNDAIIPENMNLNNHIFILVDINIKQENFTKILYWLRKQDYFECDYSFDDIINGNKQIIVLKLPRNHKNTYNYFINSKFSKMYPEEIINRYFKKTDFRFGVLTKSNSTIKSFVDKINSMHNTDLNYEEFTDEVEFFIKEEEEIFNYNLIHKYETRRKRSLTECSEKN